MAIVIAIYTHRISQAKLGAQCTLTGTGRCGGCMGGLQVQSAAKVPQISSSSTRWTATKK